jgi:LysM repeat protein
MDTGFSGLGGILYGLLAAGLSVVLVAGGLVLSFTEGEAPLLPADSPTLPPGLATRSPSSRPNLTPAAPIVPSPTPTSSPSAQPSIIWTATDTLAPTQASCPPPPGWVSITIEKGDTLNRLAQEYGTTPEELIEANCLLKSQLDPGTRIFVPGKVPPTPVRCGPLAGWTYIYVVQPGDTLFSISQRAGVSVAQLKQANCLASDTIRVGQKLYLPVPIGPPPEPTRTPTRVVFPTPTSPPPTPTEATPPTDTPAPERTPEPPPPSPEVPTPSGTQ